jgi:Tfp pilus assembly protein PilN
MKRLNLIPQKYTTRHFVVRPVELGRRTREAFLACAAAIALVSMVSFLEKRRILTAEHMYRQSELRYADVQHRQERMRDVVQTLHTLGALSRTVKNVRGQSARRLASVVRIGEDAPGGVWLTTISGVSGTIEVRGRARDTAAIGAVLRNIEHDQEFRAARFTHASKHGDSGARYTDFAFTAIPREAQ